MPRHGSLAFLWVLVAVSIAGAGRVTLAGWGPDGVTVRATNVRIPVVAACTDGGTGTFVGWQEGGNGNAPGPLRVQHLLSTGDLDPAWPADGVLASAVAPDRPFIDLLPDRQGGVYVCWVESSTLFVTRLDPSGQVAAGWPASGKSLGAVYLDQGRPRAIEDGSHGLFVAWTTGTQVVAQRFGTDGLGAGGWPDGPETVAPSGPVTVVRFWPDLALGPDGDVFVSWATWSTDTNVVQSGMYLRRLTGAGTNSPGWPTEGINVGSFRAEYLILNGEAMRAPLLDIAPDDRDGLFLIAGNLWGHRVDVRLHRLLADGQQSPGWPAGGRAPPWYPDDYYYYDSYWGPDEGLRVHPDGQDGAMVESQFFYTDSPYITGISRCSEGGPWLVQIQGVSRGHEVVVKGDGGAFLADFKPIGAFSPYDWDAFIAVDQSYPPPGWSRWFEYHSESATLWYGDIALAPAGDGGVVFFWSQERDRFGLFARRFTTAGQVTAVDPGPGAHPATSTIDHLRFVNGTGVVARVTLGGLAARLELFDVGGRRISSRTLDDVPPGADVTLPGTASLAPGLYFVRLAWKQSAAVGKVAVLR